MAVAAITPQIDKDIHFETVPKLHRHPRRLYHGFGVVGVDVKDRCLNFLGYVGRIGGKARLVGLGGVAELVVDDDVDGAASAVAGQFGEIEGFRDDPLAGKSGLAVDEYRDHPLSFRIVQVGLLGIDDALDDRIN